VEVEGGKGGLHEEEAKAIRPLPLHRPHQCIPSLSSESIRW
jgi:hypothetical protein